MKKQRAARKALEDLTAAEAARFVGQLGNEEAWSGLPLRVEVKSGAQVGPIWTRFEKAEAQSEQSRAVGDIRPFLMVAAPTRGPLLGIVRMDELARILEAVTGV